MCLTKRKSVKPAQAWSNTKRSSSEDSRYTTSSTLCTSTTSTTQSSKGSRYSSSSGSSLAGVREMVSDGVMVFNYRELRRATNNFDPTGKIGSSTFRATIRNRDAIIVLQKRGFVTNFLHKLKIIGSVHHSKIVKLLGACFTEGEHLYLVYEYIEGLNLVECLRNRKTPGFSVLDSWTKRLQVALEVSQVLEYLHDYTQGSFVHKYIKSTNIIIDNDLHSKVAKFGIPQLTGEVDWEDSEELINEEGETDGHQVPQKPTRSRSIHLIGTPGYMAPEYLSRNLVTKKVDVFSFGVVLLELLTGKDPAPIPSRNSHSNVTLPELARIIVHDDQWSRKLRLWIDPALKDSYPVNSAFDVVLIAKACVESDPEARPEMRDVAVKLSRLLSIFQKWETSMAVARNLQSREMEAR